MLGYKFKNEALLQQALTHRSAGRYNNDRLEYLGDAILDFVIADALFAKFPSASVGELTRIRASLVKKETLMQIAREKDLPRYVRLGECELKSGGWPRDSILADTFEALLGAIYLDSNFVECSNCILNIYNELLASVSLDKISKDPKTELQEYMQARKLPLPVYSVINECGRPHDLVFTVQCVIENLTEPIVADGKNRRTAEQQAAIIALRKVKEMDANF